MRNVIFINVLLACLFSASVYAEANIQEFKLKNGLTVVVKEDHRSPVVISQIWYKVGGSHEPLGITGISHMLEHLMFTGTPNHPGNQFSHLVAENGGDENARTDMDQTVYFQEVTPDKLSLMFELEADRMANLTLNEADFIKEREVVKEERRLRIDSVPHMVAYERFVAAAHLASPYAHIGIGWPSDLDNMTINDIRQWYKTWYGPNNAVVVVAGDVNPEQVRALAERYFGSIPSITLPAEKFHPIVSGVGPRTVSVKVPAKVPHLLLGYNTPSVVTEKQAPWEAYALQVVAGILSGGDSARFPKNLIRDTQIAVDAHASYDFHSRLPGLFVISGTPAQGHDLAQLKAAILKQIEKLQTTPVSDKELERVKTQIVANNIYSQDSLSAQADFIGQVLSLGFPWQATIDYPKQIRAVTAEQVQQVAKKYLTTFQLTEARLEPQSLSQEGGH